MKEKFDKLNKIMFAAAGAAVFIIFVLIIANSSNQVIGGVWGTVLTICLLTIFLFGIFAVISVALAIIDGVKKDKRALLKKFVSNITWITIAYMVPYILDYFYESEFSVQFDIGKVALRILVTALAIMGGEYMLTDHFKM